MVDAILGLVGTLLYPLFSIVFVIISLLQSLFYSFAGIGDNIQYGSTYSGNGETGMGFIPITGSSSDGGKYTTGIVYFLLNSNLIKNIFISIAVLALFLIIIFSTLAALKSIYSEKPKSWRDIITNAVKGLTSFIILPVCCLLGVWVGNILLQAVAGATSQGGTMYLDRQLFLSCSYSANIYRINTFTDSKGDEDKQNAAYDSIMATIKYYDLTNVYGGEVNATNEDGSEMQDEDGNTIKNLKNLKRGQNSEYYAQIVDQMYGLNRIPIHNHITVGVGVTAHHGYYQLWNINYLLLIVGGIFMMYVLINVTYGMVKRLFILMMLFVISPAVCAMYPLDEGNAVKSWTGDVRKNITSAYGAVAGMNLFFCFAPVIKNINFATGVVGAYFADWLFLSEIIQLILLICGLFCVNEFISLITNYFGLGNAFADGKSLRASATGALKNYGGKAVKRVGGAFARGNNSRKKTDGVGGVFRGAGAFFDEALFGGLGKDVVDGWQTGSAGKSGASGFFGGLGGAFTGGAGNLNRQADEWGLNGQSWVTENFRSGYDANNKPTFMEKFEKEGGGIKSGITTPTKRADFADNLSDATRAGLGDKGLAEVKKIIFKNDGDTRINQYSGREKAAESDMALIKTLGDSQKTYNNAVDDVAKLNLALKRLTPGSQAYNVMLQRISRAEDTRDIAGSALLKAAEDLEKKALGTQTKSMASGLKSAIDTKVKANAKSTSTKVDDLKDISSEINRAVNQALYNDPAIRAAAEKADNAK